MKKIISILLALAVLFSFCTVATAEDKELKFGEDGKFRILHIPEAFSPLKE